MGDNASPKRAQVVKAKGRGGFKIAGKTKHFRAGRQGKERKKNRLGFIGGGNPKKNKKRHLVGEKPATTPTTAPPAVTSPMETTTMA